MVLNEVSTTLPISLEQLNYPRALCQINLRLNHVMKWGLSERASS